VTFLWPFLVLLSIVGFGSGAVWLLHRLFGLELTSFADRLVLGLIVVVFAVGVVVTVGVAGLVTPIVLAGLVLGLVVGLPELRAIPDDDRARVAKVGAIGAAAVVLVAIYSVSTSLHFTWNTCDDWNYLYLAKRVSLEGNLTDPGNLRRLQSPGGMAAIQALFLDHLGTGLLTFADKFLGSLLLLAALWRERRGKWAPLGIVAAAIVIVCFPSFTGIDMNSSPVMIPAALTLVAMKYLIKMRSSDDPRAATGYGVLFGFLVATGWTLRPQIGQWLALLIGVLLVWPPFRDLFWRRAAGIVAGGVLGLLPWAVSSWRDVATPLFPALQGNSDPSFPVLGERLVALTAQELGGRVVEALVQPLWLVVLGVGLAALYDLRRRHPQQQRAQVAVRVFIGALAAGLVWLVAMTVVGWNFGPPASETITRYWQPFFVGIALTPLLVFNDLRRGVDRRTQLWSRALVLIIAVGCLFGSEFFVASLRDTVQDIGSGRVVTGLEHGKVASDQGLVGYDTNNGEYDAALAVVPPGTKVFSAVDVPDALLGTDRTVHTLDMVGFASATPHLQYFAGDEAKTQWLRDHGYEYVIAMAPGTSFCLYNDDLWIESANRPDWAAWGRPWEPYVKDWSDYVTHLEGTPGSRRFGPIVVVPIS